MITLIIVFIITALTAYLLTKYLIHHAHSKYILAHPNERSAHKEPTPHIGGVSILIVMTACLSYLTTTTHQSSIIPYCLLLLISLMAFIDDKHNLPVKPRLTIQTLATIGISFYLGGLPSIPFGEFTLDFGYKTIAIAFGAFYLICLMNIYNFLDGIDGIEGTQTLSVITGISSISLLSNQPIPIELVALAGATLGFLFCNWPPAKIFMGDVGSYLIGLFLGLSSLTSDINLWCWIILSAIFITDASTTLLRRLARKENITHAHNQHAYQHAARTLNSHKKVTLSVLAINIIWTIPLAITAHFNPSWAWLITITAYIPLIFLATKLNAGKPAK